MSAPTISATAATHTQVDKGLAVQSHVLFYRVTDAGLIDVVRILHQRMDVAAHLRD